MIALLLLLQVAPVRTYWPVTVAQLAWGAQVRALDPLHRDVELIAVPSGVVHRDHVRMVDRGREPRFAFEAGAELGSVGDI